MWFRSYNMQPIDSTLKKFTAIFVASEYSRFLKNGPSVQKYY